MFAAGTVTPATFRDGQRAGQAFELEVAAGQHLRLTKYGAYFSSRDYPAAELAGLARTALAAARSAGFEALCDAQQQYLADFWEHADVEIAGDDALQQGMRFNQFHLLQSVGRDGKTNIAAKGMTGEGYEGHHFWDTEIYIFPFFLYSKPEIARKLLEYRYAGLPKARERARELSHAKGALYPWRTIDGEECSAYFPAGTAQYHINADIAYSIKLYFEATGDIDYVAAAGLEIVLETARIWVGIGGYDRAGRFCINEVTGPDEYTALVNNNYYTNAMAQMHLRFAAEMADLLRTRRPTDFARIASAIALESFEAGEWLRAAGRMALPYDAALGIHEQEDSFLTKKAWDFAGTPKQNYPLLLNYHPLVIYRHQVCKQADVVLALLLLSDQFTLEDKKRDFDYYEAVTTHDSSLSSCIFSIIASEAGYVDQGLRLLFTDGAAGPGQHARQYPLWRPHRCHGRYLDGRGLRLCRHARDRWRAAFCAHLAGEVAPLAIQDPHPRRTAGGAHRCGARPIPAAAGRIAAAAPPRRARNLEPGRAAGAAGEQIMSRFKAVIFDLDGVVTDTAHYHYLAWKQLAEAQGVSFDHAFNEQLKGVDRMGSLNLILAASGKDYSSGKKQALAELKNRHYQELITGMSAADLLPGALEALQSVRAAGLRIGLASVSRNAFTVLDRLGIRDRFDVVVDAALIANSEPDPEIFLTAARDLGVAPADCLGVEDAVAGVAAIKSAGMMALGIGNPQVLAQADLVIPGLDHFSLRGLFE